MASISIPERRCRLLRNHNNVSLKIVDDFFYSADYGRRCAVIFTGDCKANQSSKIVVEVEKTKRCEDVACDKAVEAVAVLFPFLGEKVSGDGIHTSQHQRETEPPKGQIICFPKGIRVLVALTCGGQRSCSGGALQIV